MIEIMLVKSIERSEYSYIGPGDFFFFFQEKVKICSRSVLFFRGLTCDFLKFSAFPLLKGRQTSLSNIKSIKFTKNVINF